MFLGTSVCPSVRWSVRKERFWQKDQTWIEGLDALHLSPTLAFSLPRHFSMLTTIYKVKMFTKELSSIFQLKLNSSGENTSISKLILCFPMQQCRSHIEGRQRRRCKPLAPLVFIKRLPTQTIALAIGAW